jgi:hypothetical protein
MQSYPHGGGFSVDASVRIGQHDMQGLERLLRYCPRPPFAGHRIWIDGEKVVYRCPKAPAGEKGGASPGSKREHECHLSRYGLAKLIARMYETDPLQCGRCGGHMEIIAFVVQASEVRQILAHVG